jgi:transcription termination factor Rho
MSLIKLKKKNISELTEIAKNLGITNIGRSKKQEIIFTILKKYLQNGEEINNSGVLEILPDGFGFLRSSSSSYLAGHDDIYVSPNQIKYYNLRTGDEILGKIRPPKEYEKYFSLLKINTINEIIPEKIKNKINFENLTPLHANIKFVLEIGNGSDNDITSRIIDIISPIGKGQRALLVSPPKAGKTVMLQNIAHSLSINYPEARLIVLLIDERPEEKTFTLGGKLYCPT